MTLQTNLRGMFPPPPFAMSGAPNFGDLLLDAADEVVAYIFEAPKTGNVRGLLTRPGSITTGATVRMGLYQVVGTTGDPANTPVVLAANSFADKVIATTDALDVIDSGDFGADCAVTQGQLMAACFINPTASPGTMNFQLHQDNGARAFPYASHFAAAAWTKTAQTGQLALRYSDGTIEVPDGYQLYGDTAGTAIPITFALSTSTTPDVGGLRFRPRGPIRVRGFWLWGDWDGDADIRLVNSGWDGASSGLLASAALDNNVRSSVAANPRTGLFDASVSLSAGSFYRLLVVPNTTTSLNFYVFPISSQALFAARAYEGPDAHFTSAKDPTGDGSFTNYDNSTDGWRIPMMGLIVDQIDDALTAGAGAGNKLHGRL